MFGDLRERRAGMAYHEAERAILRHGEVQRTVGAHMRADRAHDERDDFDEFACQFGFVFHRSAPVITCILHLLHDASISHDERGPARRPDRQRARACGLTHLVSW